MSAQHESSDTLRVTAVRLDEDEQIIEPVGYDFGWSRRGFVQALGAGLLIAAVAGPVSAQERQQGRGGGGGRGGRGGGAPVPLGARLHLGNDGTITVLTGKVEGGQGSRAQLTQVAAEELRVPADRVTLVMADTALVPDDGITAGSRTTPSTVPAVRQACAAARMVLIEQAAKKWGVQQNEVKLNDDGAVTDSSGQRTFGYADLATDPAAAEAFKTVVPRDVAETPVANWRVMGKPLPRPNGREIVTGRHQYPSDVIRPGMLYGKVLRPPTYGATLASIDLEPAKKIPGVVAVRDGNFAAVAAPTTHQAKQALRAIEKTAKWESKPHPSSKALSDHLRKTAEGGMPANPHAGELERLGKAHRATYDVAYAQHAPMEPRAAVAEWADGKLTVWTASQAPSRVRGELTGAFKLPDERVRVIIPDFGGGFGGKHTGECAVEAARIAQAAGKPVALRWTRAEEFTWAYFRPAALIDVEATLGDDGKLTSWHFVNVNSGGSGIENPYATGGKSNNQHVRSTDPPLRHGSYRALAATANHFARESFIDELAHAAGKDPLAFRLTHLAGDEPRLRAVLEAVAEKFGFAERLKSKSEPNVGVGIACGTEKGSFVATCAEVAVDKAKGAVHVRRIVQTYECGKVIDPDNVVAQVSGAIIQALGPALSEVVAFEGGKVTTNSFWQYPVPRLADLPAIDVHMLDRPDLPSVGAGETPLITVAPAIANAVFHATGVRVRQMPIRLPKA